MFRKTIAAICALSMLGLAAPALADGYGHGHHHDRYHSRHYDDDGAVFAGGLLLGALIGGLVTPRPVYYAPPPVVYAPPPPALGNCREIYGTGYLDGHPARFVGTGCYDAYGNLYVMPGSERFVGYLD